MNERFADHAARADTTDDACLMAAWRRGDMGAARLLLDRFRGPLLRLCLSYLRDHADAEDAVQAVLVRAQASAALPDHPRAWLYRVARNHCLNLRRGLARRRDRERLPTGADVSATLAGQLTRMVRSEQRASLRRLLETLPPDQRETLWLRYVEELPRAEIAEVMEVSLAAVKSRLYEALTWLRGQASLMDP